MNIPKHLVIDLLPLYLADEVSDETRRLIEEYLKTDPQLAALAEQAKSAPSLQEIPAPLRKENEMEALKKVKKLMIQHNVFLALAVLTTFLFGMSLIFLPDENPIAPYVILGLAGFFWIVFFVVNRQIGD
ncbi:MAG: zf-HC2 domain-containing protein [Anaerolineales bacterium]|jgi:hypothetical protein